MWPSRYHPHSSEPESSQTVLSWGSLGSSGRGRRSVPIDVFDYLEDRIEDGGHEVVIAEFGNVDEGSGQADKDLAVIGMSSVIPGGFGKGVVIVQGRLLAGLDKYEEWTDED